MVKFYSGRGRFDGTPANTCKAGRLSSAQLPQRAGSCTIRDASQPAAAPRKPGTESRFQAGSWPHAESPRPRRRLEDRARTPAVRPSAALLQFRWGSKRTSYACALAVGVLIGHQSTSLSARCWGSMSGCSDCNLWRGWGDPCKLREGRREWMGIEPTKDCWYSPSTALKAAEPTRCPDTPRLPTGTTRGPNRASLRLLRMQVYRMAGSGASPGWRSPALLTTDRQRRRAGCRDLAWVVSSICATGRPCLPS